MTENTDNTQENQNGASVGVFATNNGIGIEVSDGSNVSQIVMGPDDASRIAVNLITNVVLFQMNNAMRAAAERAEIERAKQLITQGNKGNVPFIKR